MSYRTIAGLSLATLGIAVSSLAFAQQTSPPPRAPDSWRMPYERGFWGHAGLSLGQAETDHACVGGFNCDLKDSTWRVFAGGRFNNAVGGEVGFMDFGDFTRGGGQTEGRGLDLSLVAGIPIGANSAIFGKLGAVYSRTEVGGAPGSGLRAGKDSGWGPRYGIGGQIGLTSNVAARVDLDRYRLNFVGGEEDVDTMTVGLQYTFR